MIKLKSLISEQSKKKGIKSADFTKPFTMSDTDPWEYYLDAKTKTWYTRKKGSSKWLDMKTHLSDEQFKIAFDRFYHQNTYNISKNNNKQTGEMENWLSPINPKTGNDIWDPTQQDSGSKQQNLLKKRESGIKRDGLGYIISNKSAVYGKSFTLRSNLKDSGVVILKQIDQDEIDRNTGKIDHSFVDVAATLYPEEVKYYEIGDIKTITMPAERGAYSKQEDPNNGRKFTYLYIVGTNGYKGWIPSNVVKINS